MIHNSFDFSLAKTSSLAQIENQQNPSWINLKNLKDMIRMSSDRGNYNEGILPPKQNQKRRNSHTDVKVSNVTLSEI